MKRMILIALLLNAALLGVATLQLVAIAGQGDDRVASENGDTNGDGVRDMSDAIHMLSWLFNGGPEPGPVARARGRDLLHDGCARQAIEPRVAALRGDPALVRGVGLSLIHI